MMTQENSVIKKLDFSGADHFFKTIGEVSAEIGIPPHVLRFWESKFLSIKPHKRKGGHRYYSELDIKYIYEIKKLLYEEGFTIKGAQRHLREKGFMPHIEQHIDDNIEPQRNLFIEERSHSIAKNDVKNVNNIMDIANSMNNLDTKAVRILLSELESIKKALEN